MITVQTPSLSDVEERLRARLAVLFEQGNHRFTETARTPSVRGTIPVEMLTFKTERGETLRGFFTRPAANSGPVPAILCIHAHGGRYDIGASELLDGRPALVSPPGLAFAEAGFATFSFDLPCFGTRERETESAAAKAAQWRGGSLAGRMLGELAAGLDWLAARPDIDAARLGVFGISMGATFAYWLGAVQPRLAVIAQECCFADFATLIDLGVHDRHGHYLTVPGLLGLAGNGAIAGLCAPRPQFIGIGDQDALTPPPAVDAAWAQVQAAYDTAGAAAQLVLHREAALGHAESPAMRDALLRFFRMHLAP